MPIGYFKDIVLLIVSLSPNEVIISIVLDFYCDEREREMFWWCHHYFNSNMRKREREKIACQDRTFKASYKNVHRQVFRVFKESSERVYRYFFKYNDRESF